MKELTIGQGSGWDSEKINRLFHPIVALKILQTPIGLTGGEDKLIWPHEKSGVFSVSSGYHVIRADALAGTPQPSSSLSPPKELWETIWSASVPQKVKLFLWKVCSNALAVKRNLFCRRISPSDLCPVCLQEPETTEHTFLLCPWTRAVWFGSPLQWNISPVGLSSFSTWLLAGFRFLTGVETNPSDAIATLCMIVWGIWKGRNRVVFNSEGPCPSNTLFQIQHMIQDIHLCKTIQTERVIQGRGIIPEPKRWKPPIPGVIKINTDTSWSNRSPVCVSGVVARDDRGTLVAVQSSRSFAHSALMAEAVAMREGAILAQSLGLQDIILETDCLLLVDACRNSRSQGEIQPIVGDIKSLCHTFESCNFVWSPRETNGVAHQIALLGSQNRLAWNWCLAPPTQLMRAVQEDARWIPPRH